MVARAGCIEAFQMKPSSEDHFMFHGGGQALSFYRTWLWLEQACIEAVYLELAAFGASK